MKPLPQVRAWLALFTLLAAPPHYLGTPRGYLTAEQWRAAMAWRDACDHAQSQWDALQVVERNKHFPTVVDAIIAGLLDRDSRVAREAGIALAAGYEVWKAERAKPEGLETL